VRVEPELRSTREISWARGAQYPAEHNVGHLYYAKPALINHYMSLDPRNFFNPGLGRTSICLHWRGGQQHEVHRGASLTETGGLEGGHRGAEVKASLGPED